MAEAPVDPSEELARRTPQEEGDVDPFALEDDDYSDDISIVLNETDPDQSPFWPHEAQQTDPTNPYSTTGTKILTKSENVAKGVDFTRSLEGLAQKRVRILETCFDTLSCEKGLGQGYVGYIRRVTASLTGLATRMWIFVI